MRKLSGPLPGHTFVTLVALRHGATEAPEILRAIEQLPGAGRPPSLASFYRSLKIAIEEGLIEASDSRPAAGAGRPPLRYRLTHDGVMALEEEARRLELLATAALSGPASGRNPA